MLLLLDVLLKILEATGSSSGPSAYDGTYKDGKRYFKWYVCVLYKIHDFSVMLNN